MGNLVDLIKADVRYQDSLKACMNCGICTAICPAAEFFEYDPRRICDMVQRVDEDVIEKLLRSDTIWYCGQCMSCKTRCPRGNVPGAVITILRTVSQKMGYYKESHYGRQQEELAEGIATNIVDIGYCVHPDKVLPSKHPEQGPVWEWYIKNIEEVAPKFGAKYHGDGPGALRTISAESMEELRKIFEITGGDELREMLIKGKNQK